MLLVPSRLNAGEEILGSSLMLFAVRAPFYVRRRALLSQLIQTKYIRVIISKIERYLKELEKYRKITYHQA